MPLWKNFRQDMIAFFGEFVGTTFFLFLGLGCIKTAQDSVTQVQTETATTLSNQTILFISVGMGLSLLITAWVFYRITGGLFNPAVTLALWLIGGLSAVRAILLVVAQFAGGIAGAALVDGLTSQGGVNVAPGVANTITTLEPGMSYAKGVFLEAFLTAGLVFTVLMLAAEKHKATFMAPIGIGLTLFVCQLFGTLWTGCGMNPARSLGPSVVAARFPGYHWIYYVGPFIGSLIATFLYTVLKAAHYTDVVLGQDADAESAPARPAVGARIWHASMGFTRGQRKAMLAAGMKPDELERAEAGMVSTAAKAPSGMPLNGASPAAGRASESTLAPTNPATNMDNRHKGQEAYGPAGGQSGAGRDNEVPPELPMMGAMGQDTGGIGAPGAQKSGLTGFKFLRKSVRA